MRHPYSDIPELVELEAGGPVVRIPDRLSVAFTPRVRALVDTAAFQRLAHISQLGLAAKVYPGATHTRFEHALGVFHNACRYLWQLGKSPRFAAAIDRHHAELLLVAALLHDLGHWPFCHPIEDLHLEGLPAHEDFAGVFLGVEDRGLRVESRPEAAASTTTPLLDAELVDVLKTQWQIEPREVLDVLQPDASSAAADAPSTRLMRSILSGPIDIDKLDYLERDSWHCGVPYGRNFDRDRLIQALVPNAAGDGLAITTKGKTAAELMVFARYVMFSEVYWHHAVRAATAMFVRAFYELWPRAELAGLFPLRESEFIAALRRAAVDTPAAPLLEGLFGTKRRLHKRVLELSMTQDADLYHCLAGRPYVELAAVMQRLTQAVADTFGGPLDATDLLIDAPPVHREIEFRVDVYAAKEDRYRPLAEVSPVVAALARTQFDDSVKRVRVFAAAELRPQLRSSEVRRLLERCV